MVGCCVPKCKGRDGFSFPKSPELRQKWIFAVGRKVLNNEGQMELWEPTTGNERVCDKHFAQEEIYQVIPKVGSRVSRRVFDGVVPFLNLPSSKKIPTRKNQDNSGDPLEPLVQVEKLKVKDDCLICNTAFNENLCTLTCAICLQPLKYKETLLRHFREVHFINDFPLPKDEMRLAIEVQTEDPLFVTKLNSGLNSSTIFPATHLKSGENLFVKVGETEFESPVVEPEKNIFSNQDDSISRPQCAICKEYFLSRENVKAHLSSCHNVSDSKLESLIEDELHKPLSDLKYCFICGKTFWKQDRLQVHIQTVHGKARTASLKKIVKKSNKIDQTVLVSPKDKESVSLYQCHFCTRAFVQQELFEIHIETTHKKDKIGEADLEHVKTLEKNSKPSEFGKKEEEKIIREGRRKRLNCSKCFVESMIVEEIIEHYIEEHGLKPSEACIAVDKEFNAIRENCQNQMCFYKNQDEELLKKHMRQKHGLNMMCLVCDYEFINKRVFVEHTKVVHENIYKCPCCQKVFYKLGTFQRHIIYRNRTKLSLVCEICGKEYLSQKAIREHMKRMHLEKEFKCKECSFETFYPFRLRTHIQSRHRGGMPKKYICETCGKSFGWSTNLDDHKKKYHLQVDNNIKADNQKSLEQISSPNKRIKTK